MNISGIEEKVFKEYSSLRYDIARIVLKDQSQRGEGQTRISEENQQESAGEEEGRTKRRPAWIKKESMEKTSCLPRLLVCHYPPARRLGVLIVMQRTIRMKAVLARAFAMMEGWMGTHLDTRLGAKGVCPPVEWNKP